MFSKSGKSWAWRLGWKFSGRKSGSARTELCSQIYRGENLRHPTWELCASRWWRCVHTCYQNGETVLRVCERKLRTIFIDYYCYALKGQNVLWFPLAQMWWVTDISTWLHGLHHIRDIHILVCNTQWFIHLSIRLLLRLSKHLLILVTDEVECDLLWNRRWHSQSWFNL